MPQEVAVPRIAVLTDSTSDLSAEQAAGAGIGVVPLYVRFGGEEFRAGLDLSTEQFWMKMLTPGTPIPTTSAPSPGDFQAAFEAAFAAGAEAIVCPTIGARLSATFQSATLAAGAMPDREINVIDTGSTSMSTGIPALLAAELAAAGASAAEIAGAVRDRLPDVDLLVAVDTLEYLRKGGRLSATQAVVGSMLSVKPIITVRDGLVVMADRQRSRAKARAQVIAGIAATPVERLAILHTPTSTPDEVDQFRTQLLASIPGGVDPAKVTTGLIGASTGPHLGPDLMGAAFMRAR
jgi:DegV family protein with EDD domain